MSTVIRIGTSTCGQAAGAESVVSAVNAYVDRRQVPVTVQRTGCLGACHNEPLVEVTDNDVAVLYGPVSPERVSLVLDRHFGGGGGRWVDPSWILSRRPDHDDFPFLARQTKVTTRLCGVIDPMSLDDYLANGGYMALRDALRMPPEKVVAAVKDSRLRGRGGAGFSTGTKWEITRRQPASPKFLICNADEGDPGAFMNRTMIEGDPHRILEGMLIAAWAIGASKGYLYVRAEYPLAVKALRNAIRQAAEYGVTGKNILGSGLDFEFVIKEGAGAFVCGEETALMHSIEGQRGTPSMRPPYPSVSGLWAIPPTSTTSSPSPASPPSCCTGRRGSPPWGRSSPGGPRPSR